MRHTKIIATVGPASDSDAVLDALIAAGGLTERASRRNITLSRPTAPDGCRIVLPICYREIVQLGDTSTNYQIAPGDRIFVPTRTFWEELCPEKNECPPCGASQLPCTAVPGTCTQASGVPVSAKLSKPAADGASITGATQKEGISR